MKHVWTKALAGAAMTTMLGLSGCVLENGDLVITENVCVTLTEVQTTGTFSTFAVVDNFQERLEKKLQENGSSKKQVKSIHMVSATFKALNVAPHDWNATADIDIARQDVPGGSYEDGPATLVVFNNQSLKALMGKPTDADLLADGVLVVNRALEALLEDEDPRLVLLVENETVAPTPSESDPMSFSLLVCVQFQMVVEKGSGKK